MQLSSLFQVQFQTGIRTFPLGFAHHGPKPAFDRFRQGTVVTILATIPMNALGNDGLGLLIELQALGAPVTTENLEQDLHEDKEPFALKA
jgi:hypothetical protein